MWCSGRVVGAIMNYRPCGIAVLVVLMLGRMLARALVYQNQGNARNAGWCRPKEREAGRIGLPASWARLGSTQQVCKDGLCEGGTGGIQSERCSTSEPRRKCDGLCSGSVATESALSRDSRRAGRWRDGRLCRLSALRCAGSRAAAAQGSTSWVCVRGQRSRAIRSGGGAVALAMEVLAAEGVREGCLIMIEQAGGIDRSPG